MLKVSITKGKSFLKADARIDDSQVKKLKTLLSPEKFDKAMARVINRTLDSGYTAGNRKITEQYTVKYGDVRDLSTVHKATGKPPSGYIEYGGGSAGRSKGRMLTTLHFSQNRPRLHPKGMVVKRKRAALSVKKGAKHVMRHLFITNKDPRFLWQRNDDGSIQPMKGISIAQMVNEETEKAIAEKLQETYDKRIKHEVDRVVNKAAKG